MLEKIILCYSERNPIGYRQDRYDECYISEYDNIDGKAKEYIRKALCYMFKLVNDFHEFSGCHFIDEFGTSLYCEVSDADVWAKRKVVTVTHIDKNNNRGVPYVIDVPSLRKQLYAMCDVREV